MSTPSQETLEGFFETFVDEGCSEDIALEMAVSQMETLEDYYEEDE